ncbi:4-aminobutyrate--2-oxoglutarate transaminase [Janibacter alittae]|uniref:(S)-3-amino-2-methylpropionate transaminase n=1 Tax=Janibacter alittae TaxID=3115209 RepID=A0ABZ2MG18_9MICO
MPQLEQQRRLVTEIPGPISTSLMDRRSTAVSAGVGTVVPVFVARVDGGILQDVDGNCLIDLAAGIAVTNVGGSDPQVAGRVADQAQRFTHTCFMVAPYEGYVEVCERLAELTPGSHEKRSALFSTGSEAVENAVKIARTHTGRDAVAVFDHAYHGRTNLTMAMTAKNLPYKQGFGPFAGEVHRAPMSYPFRDPGGMTGEQAAQRAIDKLESQVGGDNLACVVIEPIQGEGGFITPAEGFLPAIADWCRERGIVFVADEVQTGFCRTGAWFACEHEGVVPDLITTAKGIAAGLPLAAVTGRAEIMDSVHAGGLGGTYGGNPVACAAALAAIDVMREQDLPAKAARLGEILTGRLTQLQQECPAIGDVRGRGAMVAIEITEPDGVTPAPAIAARVSAACHADGVLTLTCGTYGNVLRFLPPLVMPEHLLEEALDVLTKALANLTA